MAVGTANADRDAAIRLQAGLSVASASIVDLFKPQDTTDGARTLSTTADLLADTQKNLQKIQSDLSKSHTGAKTGAATATSANKSSDRLAHAHAAYADNGASTDKQAA